jgi:hypothetical protein
MGVFVLAQQLPGNSWWWVGGGTFTLAAAGACTLAHSRRAPNPPPAYSMTRKGVRNVHAATASTSTTIATVGDDGS